MNMHVYIYMNIYTCIEIEVVRSNDCVLHHVIHKAKKIYEIGTKHCLWINLGTELLQLIVHLEHCLHSNRTPHHDWLVTSLRQIEAL